MSDSLNPWKQGLLGRVREATSQTNEEIAGRCGVSRTTVQRWLKDDDSLSDDTTLRIMLYLSGNDRIMSNKDKAEAIMSIDGILRALTDDRDTRLAFMKMVEVLATK